MSQLTKEYFDERVDKLATKTHVEELARITKTGFDGVDKQLAAITKMLDVGDSDDVDQ